MTADARPRKRSVTLAGHRTSLSLEQVFWDHLAAFARQDGVSVNRLLTEIDKGRGANLSSAARVYVVTRLAQQSPGAGLQEIGGSPPPNPPPSRGRA